jgi:hydrogenase maturation protease
MNPPAFRYRAVVIGYGSTLRGDDGIGPWVAAAIAARGWPDVLALAVPQLTPELAEHLPLAGTVLFVDARLDAGSPTVAVSPLYPAGDCLSTHLADPRRLLSLAQTLRGQAPAAWLVQVAGEDFGLRETLSPRGLCHAKAAFECVKDLIQSPSSGPRG